MSLAVGVGVAPRRAPDEIEITWRAADSPLLKVRAVTERIAAAVILIGLLPLLLAVGLLVACTSPGPAVFRQTRVGQAGRWFTLYKFRTMTDRAEDELAEVIHLNEHDGVLFKIRRDPRLTSVGRFLRRSSLDELPQLWNVVRGEMSLIGPRPALPSECAHYDAVAARRLAVKPGITGLWQVSGRSELTWAESIRLDVTYVEQWSPLLDMRIALRTVGAVVSGRGAW